MIFISHGNYGSRIYDEPPSSPDYIVILICDNCLTADAGRDNVMHVIIDRKFLRDGDTEIRTIKERRVPWHREEEHEQDKTDL